MKFLKIRHSDKLTFMKIAFRVIPKEIPLEKFMRLHRVFNKMDFKKSPAEWVNKGTRN